MMLYVTEQLEKLNMLMAMWSIYWVPNTTKGINNPSSINEPVEAGILEDL